MQLKTDAGGHSNVGGVRGVGHPAAAGGEWLDGEDSLVALGTASSESSFFTHVSIDVVILLCIIRHVFYVGGALCLVLMYFYYYDWFYISTRRYSNASLAALVGKIVAWREWQFCHFGFDTGISVFFPILLVRLQYVFCAVRF